MEKHINVHTDSDYVILRPCVRKSNIGLTDAFKRKKKEQEEAFIGSNLRNLQPLLYMTAESLRLSLLHRRETGRPSAVAGRKGGKEKKRSGS